MAQSEQLTRFWQQVAQWGQLRSADHAQRWSHAVLQTLGTTLPRRLRRTLARTLPEGLGHSVTDVFWLLHFPDTNMPALEFQRRVALRAGNTDLYFARIPAVAVFAALQPLLTGELRESLADALSPELRTLWQEATRLS
jgi:uncharacterized protein (DUF2267 family)